MSADDLSKAYNKVIYLSTLMLYCLIAGGYVL